jgi:hypothetical protein
MNSLTLFFALPAGVFVFVAGLLYLHRSLPRWMALLPVLACYACAAFVLLMGGCHNVAHVALEGLEMDLMDEDGHARQIVIGGEAEPGKPSGIEVPGYPVDALRLSLQEDGSLALQPGSGYQRGILVRSGSEIVPVEPGGLPRLVSLQSGDSIQIKENAGGDVLAQWRLGTGKYDLNLDRAAYRWIGGADKGIARMEGMADQVIGVRAEGSTLFIKKGPGFNPSLGVMLNGRRLEFGALDELRTVYQPEITKLAIVGPDPAMGSVRLVESGFQRYNAELQWESTQHANPLAHPIELESARVYRVGGAFEDDFVVQGLPPGALQLVISADGKMTLELSETGKKAIANREFTGSYPQANTEFNQGVRVGAEGDPAGGIFILLSKSEPAPPPTPEASSESTSLAPVTSLSPSPRWKCAWLPNAITKWRLPNREIVLPLMNLDVRLGSRRPWTQKVFPLAGVTPRESGLRSMLVYGQPHDQFRFNGVNLLQLEQGLRIERNGTELEAPARRLGVLSKGQKVEFLQVLAEEQGPTHGVAFGRPEHPANVYEAKRVSLRKRFPEFTVIVRTEGTGRKQRKIPVLRVTFEKPVIRSIPLGEVKEDLAARNDGAQILKVAINDRTTFSTIQHQVVFPGLSRWFDTANADTELNWMSFNVRDDWRQQMSLAYSEPFKIGQDRRLVLRITKHAVPWSTVGAVGLMGLVACGLCLWHGAGFSWMSLFFGAAFLTCSRVLFGQASLVNAPFNGEILRHAMLALVVTPLIIGVGGVLIRQLLPGKIEKRLRALESWISYRKLILIALAALVVRALLLAAGFKEALPLGSTRIALSIAFVPFFLLLFSLSFFIVWREKLQRGWLRWAQVMPFIRCAFILSACQGITALLVSDLGMMLYFIPQALVMAVIGGVAGTESLLAWLREEPTASDRSTRLRHAILSGLLPILPLAMMTLVFTKPQWVLSLVPGLHAKVSTEDQDMVEDAQMVTDSTLLRVLQFTNPEYLINLGTDSAERIAQDHAIMENYAQRGFLGEGYLKVDVLPAKFVTAMNDNVSAIFIFAQFGVLGALAVVVAYLAISLATAGAHSRQHSFTSWLAIIAGLSFCLVSVYMIGANFGLLPFTGRNMYLLGLNSLSDVVESLLLLTCIVLGITRAEFHDQAESVQNAASLGLGEIVAGPTDERRSPPPIE